MVLRKDLEDQGNWLFRHRSLLPLTVLSLGLAVFIYSNFVGDILQPCLSSIGAWAFAVSLIGLSIRIYTIGYSAENTSGRNTSSGQIADTLNTAGMYSIVRNPLYLGNFFMWLGPAILTGNIWFTIAFILMYWIYYERIVFAEEQFLERKFGEPYLKWADAVPVFIPNFRLFRLPEGSFNYMKVIRQEKNGLFALFLVFAFFDFLGESIGKHSHYNNFFVIGGIFALVLYLIVKLMKIYARWHS